MNIKNKIFYTIIGVVTLLCLIIGLFIRSSITEFKFEDINKIANSLSYSPYDDIEYSNGTYIDTSEIKNTGSTYKYIVKGKCSGKRKVLEGVVLTEIQVDEVLKGEISNKKIKIYEPVSIGGKASTLSSFDGYNFIKDDKEYIFCLTDLKEGVKNYDENNVKIYNYLTPFYGKFPVKYNESDFKVYIQDKDEKSKVYSEFQDYEQVFSSEDRKNMYLAEYKKIIKLSNNH